MRFSREEAIENQLRQCTELVSLPDGWAENLLAQIAHWKAEAESSSSAAIADASARLSEVEGKLSRLTDLVADGVISAEEYSPRKEALLLKKTELTDRLASFQQKGDPSPHRLELFVREAQRARDVAVTENPESMTAFHRKIGSNFLLFGPERISRGVIGPRQRSRSDGRSDRVDGVSPAGEREESDHVSGGDAAVPRANQVTENPETQRVSGSPLAVSENLRDWIPVPFDPNRSRPTLRRQGFGGQASFTKSGKPLRKIRQKGLPVLAVHFPGPWRLLATRPENEKWWRLNRDTRSWFETHYPKS